MPDNFPARLRALSDIVMAIEDYDYGVAAQLTRDARFMGGASWYMACGSVVTLLKDLHHEHYDLTEAVDPDMGPDVAIRLLQRCV